MTAISHILLLIAKFLLNKLAFSKLNSFNLKTAAEKRPRKGMNKNKFGAKKRETVATSKNLKRKKIKLKAVTNQILEEKRIKLHIEVQT